MYTPIYRFFTRIYAICASIDNNRTVFLGRRCKSCEVNRGESAPQIGPSIHRLSAARQSRNQSRAMAVPAMIEHGRDARGTKSSQQGPGN
jgi:hypothetical protein